MKRPLLVFTIYLFTFMSMTAIAGHLTNDADITSTTVAQAQSATSVVRH